MAWVARQSDNTTRTPSPYGRHDKDNNPAAAPADYQRHDKDNNLDSSQPTSVTQTDDYGNTFKDWNGDYSG